MKSLSHLSAKGRNKPSNGNKNESLITREMEDREIEEAIQQDLAALSTKHSWKSLAEFFDGEEADSVDAELLLRLNILVRQNELILRALKRRSPTSTNAAEVAATIVNST